MLTHIRRVLAASPVIVLALVSACGDDPVGPDGVTRTDITRSFAATTFTTRIGGLTIDQLARGSIFNVTLREDGTTTGRLFVPGGGEGGGDLDENLAGTFTFDDSSDEVTFAQASETFVGNVTFTASRSGGVVQLEAEETLDGTTVHVVLR